MRGTGKSSRGFTLVEAFIVLIILGILIALAVPKIEVSRTVAAVAQARQGLQVMATSIFAYKDSTMTGGNLPPGGEIMQTGWNAWSNSASDMVPNSPGNQFHACSVLWLSGSFYSQKGADRPQFAAPVPGTRTHYDLRVLTSPVETLTVIPRDPFKENGEFERSQFDYFGINLMEEFAIRSLGPDGIADVGCETGGFDCGCIESACLQLGSSIPGRRVFDATSDSHFECPGCSTVHEALRIGEIVYSPTNGIESTGDLFYSSVDGKPDNSDVSRWEVF